MALLSYFIRFYLFFISGKAGHSSSDSPSVTVINGTYTGIYQPTYNQDYFLGIPYAQPPVGNLRFANPEPLITTWQCSKPAVNYYPECVGYGGDDIGYSVSEDCLALNVVRPAGCEGQNLPVGVWIHGGGFVMGGTPDLRYNLSFIVSNSINIGKPIIGVSIAYRLSAFGFLDGQEIRSAGYTNVGLRDQRLALQWIQENIAAFGGDPTKVTIWGESAGALSVGHHLIAYGGRDDKLFRSAISESGTPILGGPKYNLTTGQTIYDNITKLTGCSDTNDSLTCLQDVDFSILNAAVNITPSYEFFPYIDGDFIQGSVYNQLEKGQFVKVPYLIGTNSDEGSAFGKLGINDDMGFEAYLNSTGANYESVKILEIVYPNIPALGVLDTVNFTPNSTYGSQWKRSAAFGGDFTFTAARRLINQQWAKFDIPSFAYRFNVIVNPLPSLIGVTHFQEVAFIFDNIQGLGYKFNPFENEPTSFLNLAKLMSCMWVSFIHDMDPNGHGQSNIPQWPIYETGANGGDDSIGGYSQDFVFDVNVTSHPEPDTYRGVAINYLNTLWATQFGK